MSSTQFYFCDHCKRKYKRSDKLVAHVQKAHNKILDVIPELKEFTRRNNKQIKPKANKEKKVIIKEVIKVVIKEVIKEVPVEIPHNNDNKNNENNENNECMICFEEITRKVALVPCGHSQYCEYCVKLIEKCAECRSNIRERIRIY